jgi:16S rRNA (adenine1518-N6/adenine1519-N6)-dimethyltransferase
MVFLVQKEVAQRICAKPPHLNLLAISVQFYGKPKILFYVSKEFFFPSPKVDGAVIKILPYSSPFLSFPSLFFKIVKVGFSHPRKQILNNLAKGLNLNKEKVKNWLLKNKIDPQKRAENLTLRDWKKLIKTLPS